MAKKETIEAAAPAAPGTAVVTWREKMAMVTAQAAASEATKGGFLSFKGGNMSYDDNMIAGNKLEVVVLDFMLENAIFREKYNPSKPASPMCYAFGREEDTMVPHPEAEEPQAASCAVCPNNDWASDPEGGRGKACKNSRRIALLPADVLSRGVADIAKANVVMCKLPVTSIKNFSAYINQVVKVLEQPPFAVRCELSVKPHPTSLFQVHWKIIDVIQADEVLEALFNRRAAFEKMLSQPYPKFEDKPDAKPRSGKY